MDGRVGVLLLNLGGPDTPEAIRPFLRNLFNDREIIRLPGGNLGQRFIAWMIVRSRIKEVRANYAAIGGASPILALTRKQATGLERALANERSIAARVLPAMRYWHPYTREALAELRSEGIRRIVALTLYPHYSMATTGSSANDLERVAAHEFPGAFEITTIDRWAELPGYLDALAGRANEALNRIPEERRGGTVVLFSAHGLPIDFIERGDPYVEEITATMNGILARLEPRPAARLSYQSKVGPVKWLEPTTQETMHTLAGDGVRDVVIVPISFVTDHIETLHEIDIEFAELAHELGFESFVRTRALDDDPTLMSALAGLVADHLTTGN